MNRDRLKRALVRHEGLRLKPYTCTANKLTIGVGRNIQDNGISEAEAMLLLENDIDAIVRDLNRALPWWQQLDEARREVLANMVFNMGIGTVLTFKNTLAAVQAGDYKKAAALMLQSKWATQVGNRAKELAAQMETGKAT